MNNELETVKVSDPFVYVIGDPIRTPYILAKSLFLAYTLLDQEEDIKERQPSDISDILELLNTNYPQMLQAFRNCQERGIQV